MTTQTLEVFLDSIFYNHNLHSATIWFDKHGCPSILKEYLDEKCENWMSVYIMCGRPKYDIPFSYLQLIQLKNHYLEVSF